jgi:hypothetical protein
VIASARYCTTLKRLHLDVTVSEMFCDVLAAALLSNSTLQRLTFIAPGDSSSCSWLSPLFLAPVCPFAFDDVTSQDILPSLPTLYYRSTLNQRRN